MSVAFDHLMVMVADEAAAAQEFSQAGFTVTPRSELPGMANRLICFPSSAVHAACFVELLSVERPEDVPPPHSEVCRFDARAGGYRVGGAGSGRVAAASVSEGGWSIRTRRDQAPMDTPTGETLDVALDILIGDDESLPFKWAAVQHYTVEHYQRPDSCGMPTASRICGQLRSQSMILGLWRSGWKRCSAVHIDRCGESAIVALGNVQLLMLANGATRLPTPCEGSPIVGVVLQEDADEIDIDHVTYNLALRMQIEDSLGAQEISHLKLFPVESLPRSPDRSDTA